MREHAAIVADLSQAVARREADHVMPYVLELEERGTPESIALAKQTRGDMLRWAARYDEARGWYDEALSAFQAINDLTGIANVTNNMGILHWSTGQYQLAIEQWKQAYEAHRGRNDLPNATRVQMNLGIAYGVMGDPTAALRNHVEALHTAESINAPHIIATALGNIGLTYKDGGDYPAALEYLQRALDAHTKNGNRSGIATTELSIGGVLHNLGELPRALEHYHRALDRFAELNDPVNTIVATENIGALFQEMGDVESALQYYRQALHHATEIGESTMIANTLWSTATLLLVNGRLDEVPPLIERLEGMNLEIVTHRIQVARLRAEWLLSGGDLTGADAELHRAVNIAIEAGRKAEEADVRRSLRELALRRRDIDDYVVHNDAYQRLIDEIKGSETMRRIALQQAQRSVDAERAEAERHRSLVHTMLPRDVATRVLNGESVNDAIDLAAVMFLDMVNFTSMASGLTSSELVSLLRQIFGICDEVVARHGMITIKTIGDAYMATAFAKTENQKPNTGNQTPETDSERPANGNAVLNAARAAVELVSTLAERHPEISVRVGLHCGPVTAGVIGTVRLQYDIWGDTVNVASRMESLSEPGRIHVSEAFASRLRGNDEEDGGGDENNRHPREGRDPSPHPPIPLSVISRGTLDIKGKGPMTTYWLEGVSRTTS